MAGLSARIEDPWHDLLRDIKRDEVNHVREVERGLLKLRNLIHQADDEALADAQNDSVREIFLNSIPKDLVEDIEGLRDQIRQIVIHAWRPELADPNVIDQIVAGKVRQAMEAIINEGQGNLHQKAANTKVLINFLGSIIDNHGLTNPTAAGLQTAREQIKLCFTPDSYDRIKRLCHNFGVLI